MSKPCIKSTQSSDLLWNSWCGSSERWQPSPLLNDPRTNSCCRFTSSQSPFIKTHMKTLWRVMTICRLESWMFVQPACQHTSCRFCVFFLKIVASLCNLQSWMYVCRQDGYSKQRAEGFRDITGVPGRSDSPKAWTKDLFLPSLPSFISTILFLLLLPFPSLLLPVLPHLSSPPLFFLSQSTCQLRFSSLCSATGKSLKWSRCLATWDYFNFFGLCGFAFS